MVTYCTISWKIKILKAAANLDLFHLRFRLLRAVRPLGETAASMLIRGARRSVNLR